MGGQIESVAVPSTVRAIHPLPQGLLLLVTPSRDLNGLHCNIVARVHGEQERH